MRNLTVKRVYDKPAKSDGTRVLVDRLWPRGIKKEEARVDLWTKELAPPRELVAWFHVDKNKRFKEFEKKYHSYLTDKKGAAKDVTSRKGKVTLITAVKDIDHSHIPTLLRLFSK